jgi:Permeases of the drug/metabolite transporter (DMT) superfamily
MFTKSPYWHHMLAIFSVFVWGITFVSTKILINHGLSPAEIFFCRFALAYIGIWFVGRRALFAKSLKDELLCVALGLGGGSLYFLFENTALEITLASNVSLIVCTAPIFTAFLSHLFYKREKIGNHLMVGSLIALAGVALVAFNGKFILQINPLGDLLSVLAALSWAFYSIILRKLQKNYSTLFITRKVFFYGILTILPFLNFDSGIMPWQILLEPAVIGNLVFLGLVASLLCFITWNTAVKQLGIIQTSNYIYFIPLVTLLTSAIVINEHITVIAIIGSVFILCGVYISEKGLKFKQNIINFTNQKQK